MSKSAGTCHTFSSCNLLDQVLFFQSMSHLHGHPTKKKKIVLGEDGYAHKCLTTG